MSYALEIEGLEKIYANGLQALKGIDLKVSQGDFFALLGPNGAGKSTTIGVICSLVNKTAGTVRVKGVDIDADFPKAKRHLGVVPQEFNFNVFESVEDILIHQAGYYGIPLKTARERIDTYLAKLGLTDKRHTRARMLSGGMKRRLMIARALIHEPSVLILDEPTAGVDIEMRRAMYDFLKEINAAGTTIILTTHYLEEAESLCRNIAIINHGEIVTNTSMKNLLRELHRETFILDARERLPEDLSVEGFELTRVDDFCLQAHIEQGQDIAELMSRLHDRGIGIISMRNRENRLEQMFVSLLEQGA
ncbi:MAG: ABC transporter [Halieaceae bacterium]|jgi:ABC-2 type transport system ATP-binding protein|nr:ABC transporter [Halieaceae bacterium]|tara:strand:+ start:178 stop:1095 length:918 start_codon:yes stop_codon:yes gene_type:complete